MHPAIFPEQLASDHILSWTNEGDIVYDPFSGSGTTLKMARKLNRNYIGSEINEEYFKLIEERLKRHVRNYCSEIREFLKLTFVSNYFTA